MTLISEILKLNIQITVRFCKEINRESNQFVRPKDVMCNYVLRLNKNNREEKHFIVLHNNSINGRKSRSI